MSVTTTFDEAELLDRLDGDFELFADLAQTFVDAYRAQMAVLRECLDAADFGALARQAHAMKGGLLTLSARAAAHAVALEVAAKAGQSDKSHGCVEALELELPALANELGAAIVRLKA